MNGRGPPPLSPAPRTAHLPLSYSQERMWFLQEFDPANPSYFVPLTGRLRGPLEVEPLRRGIEEIVRRHEVLRTAFPAPAGVPRQEIREAERWELPVDDLRRLDEGARARELSRIWIEEVCRPFDLAAGPLLRTRLVRLADEDHALLVATHHAVSDGWSVGVFWRELRALYDAFVGGHSADLAPLEVQYADYAVWQRRWLAGPELDRQLAYWRTRLAGVPEETALPFKGARPPVQDFRGKAASAELDADSWTRLRELARRNGATPFMAALAGLRALLWFYTSQEDVCVGTPVANRYPAAVHGMIGCFVNTVVLRTRIDPQASFTALLRAERQTAREAFGHQHTPFGLVVEAAGVARSPSRPPLFQVMMTDWTVPLAAREQWIGLEVAPLELEAELAQLDLSVFMWERDGRLVLRFEYAAAMFDPGTVEQLARHVARLLEQVAAAPDGRICDVELLDEREREAVVRRWHGAEREIAPVTVAQMVSAQAARHPQRVAVESHADSLTYEALDRRSDELARRLALLGARAEDRVGVCVDRGPDLLVAMLGVLKAGAAYLPIDPDLPDDRLAYMVGDSGLRLLVVDQALEGRLDVGVDKVRVDKVRVDAAASPSSRGAPVATIGLDRLAYLMYTSGSTGRPKGVQISHRALVNFLRSMQESPGLSEDDTLLAVTTTSFDISGLELFLPLVAGGKVVIASRAEARDGLELCRLLDRGDITVLQATPSAWRMLAAAGWQGKADLVALCGGEALPGDLAEWLAPRVAALWNMYGPTETTIWSSAYRLEAGAPVRLGDAVANTQLYVLEPISLQAAPLGVAGELFIGGEGLARGYWGRPDLTAERFLPDPHGAPGARMYRTGDLARRRMDGGLEYLGRVDHQVKVRGYRIELGEIESVLCDHPSVSQCVVVARDAPGGGKQLAAYVVPAAGRADVAVLKAHLRERLPEYMVPAAFVELGALPLTPNRKVDRKALPPPADDGYERAAYAAPATLDEQGLARIFADLLGVERVSVHDDFFALGGHSLLATLVVLRARESLGVELPLRRLFETPTVAALAAEVARRRVAVTADDAAPLVATTRDEAPLSVRQEWFWALNRAEPTSPEQNMALAYRLRGALDRDALHHALDGVVRRHEVLRTVFAHRGGGPHQEIRAPARVDLPVERVNGAVDEAALVRLADQEAQRPFDLTAEVPMRARLIEIGDRDHLFLVTKHHIASDGWSVGILWRELTALHDAFGRGEAAALAPLPIQFADYAVWQRGASAVRERDLAYWGTRLDGAPAETTLPARAARRSPGTFNGAALVMQIDEDLSERLRALSRRAGTTLFMTLLAGFRAELHRAGGQEDLCIGTLTANRTEREVESLIGPVFNWLVLRGRVDGRTRFADLLAREKETVLEAQEHQRTPFEEVVAACAAERDAARRPLFQILFALQNLSWEEARLGGVAVEPLRGPIRDAFSGKVSEAQHDLAVHLFEQGGRVHAHFTYDADLFEHAEVERVIAGYRAVLAAMAGSPGGVVGEVP